MQEHSAVDKLFPLNDAQKLRLALVRGHAESITQANEAAAAEGRGGADPAAGGAPLDSQREQEQEQEQEQEKMKEQEEEQQKMSQFSRDNEEHNHWQASILAAPINRTQHADALAASSSFDEFAAMILGDDPFYPLAAFRCRREVDALPFPPQVREETLCVCVCVYV